MASHPNESSIINLRPVRPSERLREQIEEELSRESADAVDHKKFADFLREVCFVAVLRMNGRRYHIHAMRVMLDDDESRLKADFVQAVVADAVRQAIRRQHPDRQHVDVEVTWCEANDEGTYVVYQAHVWWNHRRQYEELYVAVHQ